MTAAVVSDEVERRSSIPRDMTYLVHKGTMMNERKTIKENNIEAEATIEMSLRLVGRNGRKCNDGSHLEILSTSRTTTRSATTRLKRSTR